MPASKPVKLPIRSYVRRTRRLTVSQQRALDGLWQDYVIDFRPQQMDFAAYYPKAQPLTVEIGFGMGDSLLVMAQEQAQINFLGIEVHKPGLGKLMQRASLAGLDNLKLMCHDAVEVLKHCCGPNSIDRFLMYFPDPWHKKRHHKRRLIQPDFVSLLVSRLRLGGTLHLATDWEPYAMQMMEVLEQQTQLSNCLGPGGYWPYPERPATRFEQRGRLLGHGVWDLLFEKIG
ncbi:MAG: tRNA (guanosine(46)-N7)-methyltransferase TrmB [Gammaproteobacteria bacterium]|nr:tRNA (guanosine(46)-N7)-methyltransferase TrmB [Gammaproteobacteria bacterium]